MTMFSLFITTILLTYNSTFSLNKSMLSVFLGFSIFAFFCIYFSLTFHCDSVFVLGMNGVESWFIHQCVLALAFSVFSFPL